MQKVPLNEELRVKLLDEYMAGRIDLAGYETNLKAISVHGGPKAFMPHETIVRLIRAKHITLLNGVVL
jgi:hypothetical protein